MTENVYRDQVLVVEPTGIEHISPQQRHGMPRNLFNVWFSANTEISTWMLGVFIVALYGTGLKTAALGIVVGNLAGYALLGAMAVLGPKYGAPMMVASRLAFGRQGNRIISAISFFSSVGWCGVNTIFGIYELESVAHVPYLLGLGIMFVLQVLLAVYGYNMIHTFERASALLLAAGFILLGYATLHAIDWNAGFNPHAPLAAGGPVAGFIFATALTFSYSVSWSPSSADYARYLPETSSPWKVWAWSFAGNFLPSTLLEILGAGTVSATHVNLLAGIPTDAIGMLLGPGILAKLVLLVCVLGTLTCNCINLYSGSLSGLVAFRIRVPRWAASVAVGVFGAAIALWGSSTRSTANGYAEFLLLLSYWCAPWVAVVLADWWLHRGERRDPYAASAWKPGLIAFFAGVLASVPFWNQALFVGAFARAFPQYADLAYYVGFAVAAACMLLLGSTALARRPNNEESVSA
jgi:NCS1 family nucleobase:cation symporter-1